LAPEGVTRSGHKFRANAAPNTPQGVLLTIFESEDSSSSDEDLADAMQPLPDAPQKGTAPTKQFANDTPSSSANTGAAARPTNLGETMQSVAQVPLRRSQRESKPPQRLESTYLRAPHRAPPPGSATYATFPFPYQPLVPNFPPLIPDLGPDPITYRDAVTSPDNELWQIAIQHE
jgi:hypothetical protein